MLPSSEIIILVTYIYVLVASRDVPTSAIPGLFFVNVF